MKNFILNGELYVKVAPTIESHYKIQASNFFIDDVYNNSKSVMINNEEDLKQLDPYLIEFLERIGAIKKEDKKIEDNNGFFQIYTDGNKIIMFHRETKKTLIFESYEEILQNFMTFEDFLNQAVYIGRQLNGADNIELLYEFKGLWLIKIDNQYTIINKYQILNQYKIGDILPYYYEKTALYHDIIKNILKINGKNR